jgi:2-polyprenyl-6-hydroxyphenyl methylase/3-demethylubiquinone-9 3-methyltransferase
VIWWSDALESFDSLPLAERVFVRARAFSAPLEALAHRVVGHDVVDVGCGHGVLVAMLARRAGHVTGIDPDARKIEWARRSVGRLPNVSVQVARVEDLAADSFDSMCIADVLYLLPQAQWPSFFASAHRALRQGGQLLLKEAEDDGSWRVRKALWQERLMVGLLRRTHSSGAVQVAPRQTMIDALVSSGFRLCEVSTLSQGYSTPHVLLSAQKEDTALSPAVGT